MRSELVRLTYHCPVPTHFRRSYGRGSQSKVAPQSDRHGAALRVLILSHPCLEGVAPEQKRVGFGCRKRREEGFDNRRLDEVKVIVCEQGETFHACGLRDVRLCFQEYWWRLT